MTTMKVVRFYPPGGAEKLKYEDEQIPSPEKGEVLIKVKAAGLIWTELTWPIYQNKEGKWIPHIPGHDFSGIVAEIGPECQKKDLEVGSEVLAFTSKRNHEGGLAEYALADEDQVLVKPRNLSFLEAAAVPLSALTAWQALYDHGRLQKGQRVLVTGGAGGTGTFAVQLAKISGAYVIATVSSDKSKEIMQELGVDEIIDYKQTNLEEAVKGVDVVIDCVGDSVIEQCLKVVKADGLLVSINTWGAAEKAKAAGRNGMFFIVKMNESQLSRICQMLEEGILKVVSDSVFPLQKTREAFEYAAERHVHGKVVISVPE